MSNPLPKYPAFRWDDVDRDLVFTWSGGHDDPVQIHSGRTIVGAEFKLSRGFLAAAESSMLDLSDVLALWQTQCAAWRRPVSEREQNAADEIATAYLDLDRAVTKAKAAGDEIAMDHLNAVYVAAQDLMLVRADNE